MLQERHQVKEYPTTFQQHKGREIKYSVPRFFEISG